jgi:hypothetical protein
MKVDLHRGWVARPSLSFQHRGWGGGRLATIAGESATNSRPAAPSSSCFLPGARGFAGSYTASSTLSCFLKPAPASSTRSCFGQYSIMVTTLSGLQHCHLQQVLTWLYIDVVILLHATDDIVPNYILLCLFY